MRWSLSIEGRTKSREATGLSLKSRKASTIQTMVASACRLTTARPSWHRFNGSSSSSNAPYSFCFDVIAKNVAEHGRSRAIGPERSRRCTALSECKAPGCTHAAAAFPALISQSPRSPSLILSERPPSRWR